MSSRSNESQEDKVIRLAYGDDGIEVRIPPQADCRILRTRPCPALTDPVDSIRQAIEKPTGSPPLAELAKGRNSACIVICDITRPIPNALLLGPILNTIEEAGVPRDAITILIATGIHRPNLGEELDRLVGAEIAAGYNIVNHMSKDDGELQHVGETSDGIPLYINKHYLAADLKILTGFIEPHLWAGYSGGRKLILPGITGLETMKYMHGFEMVDHRGTVYGNLDGNPFHKAGLEVAEKVGVDFILNVTMNESRELTGVFAGDCRQAHLEGAQFCEKWSMAELDEPVDLAITCAGGQPLERSLYQSVKGMSGANPIVRPGGTILIASRCDDQAGSEEFTALLESAGSVEGFLERLQQPGFFEVDQWIAQEMYQIGKSKRIALFSEGLGAERTREFLLDPVEDMQTFVDRFIAENPSARIAVMPEGPYVITRLQKK